MGKSGSGSALFDDEDRFREAGPRERRQERLLADAVHRRVDRAGRTRGVGRQDRVRTGQIGVQDAVVQGLPAAVRAGDVGQARDRGDLRGDLGVRRGHDLGAVAEIDLVAVVARGVVAGRDLHARHRAQVPYGVREYGRRKGAGEHGGAQARARHDRRRVAGEVGGLVSGVVADDDEAVGPALRLQVRGEAGGGADDDRAVHAHRARAEFAAQAGRAELEGAAEACGELRRVLGVDQLGEFLTGFRVGVLGQPCLGPCGEFVLHVGSTSLFVLSSCGAAYPSRPWGLRPQTPLIGLNGLVLKRRTGW
ncbi:hypothetical protein QFZ24_003977 [Streptomyces phaeochromogenes]|nr:hypothetical protein [Streptomyces phaeochromogenes]